MCGLAVDEAKEGNMQVISDIQKLICNPSTTNNNTTISLTTDAKNDATRDVKNDSIPTPEELCSHILHTIYMGTTNSSMATQNRSLRLANAIGSYHGAFHIDDIVSSVLRVFSLISGQVNVLHMYNVYTYCPRYKCNHITRGYKPDHSKNMPL